ncbi:hypothetical protein J4450_02695 [Candidatus Micrarchaeota archaeon]|nr:hypothetical protein [Candidatus Micrarchaeota archaeon]
MVEKQLEELTPTQAKRFAIQTVQSELKTRGLELTGFAVNAVVDEAIKTARTKPDLREKISKILNINKELRGAPLVDPEAVALGQQYKREVEEFNQGIRKLQGLKEAREELKGEAHGIMDDLRDGRINSANASSRFQGILDKLAENIKESNQPGNLITVRKLKKEFFHTMKEHLVKTNPEFAANNETFQRLHHKTDRTADENTALSEVTRKMEETLERESRGVLKFPKHD